ncbi:winged helix DNA-binding domain-containing protein [uncultured Cellulomonas sp.]|uniref:winged helix DNA-binding domain-containing protein n=1 Tax=uncultured Cellulomonas sp. TaxID=189682 RepID=UPI0028F0A28F|nr:winged helix DNA-binding domain-containing protein [uncultured Cellulomonas sp.]
MPVTRRQVLRYRVHAQQLDRAERAGRSPDDAAILDLGVQDTGPDGSLWALAVRGVPVTARDWPRELALAWTVRGAPHAYRRADLRAVEKALRPYSETDAAKRVITAAAPLADAGIPVLDALATVSRTMREVVDEPLVKGELSTRMTAEVGEPYVRWCAGCRATHMYEMTFRLAALHAGLELEPGTSPPVLRRIPRWPAGQVGVLDRPTEGDDGRLDLVRGLLHLLGPTTPRQAAVYLDSTVRDVTARWPDDAVEVEVDGVRASMLDADLAALEDPPDEPVVRLLGPYDLYLQSRDRNLVVPDKAHHKALWPTIGRPGGVLVDGDVVGTWRPRAKASTLALELDPWVPWSATTRDAVEVEHARLARFRGVTPA